MKWLYVCFVDRCLSFCTFSFGHCVVCSSSIYGFWLPLWYLQVLLPLNCVDEVCVYTYHSHNCVQSSRAHMYNYSHIQDQYMFHCWGKDFSIICMFCRSLFVLLYFFFWPLCCLFIFDIRILIAPLVFSNSSSYVRSLSVQYLNDLSYFVNIKVQKDKQRSTKHTYNTKYSAVGFSSEKKKQTQ
jgi:hypothetical protein